MTNFLNLHGPGAVALAGQMLWQSALLVTVLGLLDLTVGRRWRSTLRCALWSLVVVKLLLPPSLAVPTGAGFWLGRWLAEPMAPTVSARGATVVELTEPTLSRLGELTPQAARPGSETLSVPARLLLLWVVGAGLLGVGWVIRHRPVSRLREGAVSAPGELQLQLESAAAELGVRRLPRLDVSRAHHSPAICGLLRPVILLPAGLAESLSPAGLRAVLLHELVHLRRRDLWVNLLQVVVQVLWWWNPLVWLVNARIRTHRERAVDEAVLLATREDLVTYPSTLVQVARHCAVRPILALSFLGIFESHRTLRARVLRLLNGPVPARADLGWPGWLSWVAAALLAVPMGFPRRVAADEALRAAPADGVRRVAMTDGAASGSKKGSAEDAAAKALGAAPAAGTAPLMTRQYRVNPNAFFERLESVLGRPVGRRSDGGAETSPTPEAQSALREVLAAAGVTFPNPSGTALPPGQDVKSFFFDDRRGLLFVRATGADLDIIEKAIQTLSPVPPQVHLEVRLVEFQGDVGPELTQELQRFAKGSVDPDAPSFTGVLTEARFPTVLRALEARPGFKVLAAPRMTTLTGRQAQVSMIDPRDVPDPSTGTTRSVGVGTILDVVPWVQADDQSIQLTVLASVSEELGEVAPSAAAPKRQATYLKANAALWDGQTLVLGGDVLVGADGRADRGGASEPKSTNGRRRLLVFVTPTIIDPAGQRLNRPENMPFDPNTVPPQPK